MTLVATESQYKILERINPLQTTLIERSIVSSRVALLLRSAEIKLLFSRFVFLKHFPCGELVKETDDTLGEGVFFVVVVGVDGGVCCDWVRFFGLYDKTLLD